MRTSISGVRWNAVIYTFVDNFFVTDRPGVSLFKIRTRFSDYFIV